MQPIAASAAPIERAPPLDLRRLIRSRAGGVAWRGGAALRLRLDAPGCWRVAFRVTRPLLILLDPAPKRGELRLEDGRAWASDGAAVAHFLTPGTMLEGRLDGPLGGIALSMRGWLPLDGSRRAASLLGLDDAFLTHLLASLDKATADGAAATAEAIARAVVARLVARLPAEPARAASGLQTWRLRRVRAFIDQNLGRPLTLDELASASGLSTFHFARSFARATGVSPFAYLRQRRCDRARHLLATTTLPLLEVAKRCGFCSQSHFTSVFQQAEGLPPGRWRASMGGPTD